MKLYHVGFDVIKDVDLTHGRKNADFGQGFYLSPDLDFSKSWATFSNSQDTILNIYELNTDDLKILEFNGRDEKWFDYIFKNRNNVNDIYSEYDVIIGPIANDTIFDLYGIVTSGLLDNKKALEVLKEGPLYRQIVIKKEKAKNQLKFIRSEILNKKDILENKESIKKIESDYQDQVFLMLDDNVKDMLS